MTFDRIAVLGAGAWGCALANVTARAGRKVTVWSRHEKPATKLADGVEITSDIGHAVRADAVLAVVPAQAMRELMLAIEDRVPSGTPIVTCAKGIERGSHKFMT